MNKHNSAIAKGLSQNIGGVNHVPLKIRNIKYLVNTRKAYEAVHNNPIFLEDEVFSAKRHSATIVAAVIAIITLIGCLYSSIWFLAGGIVFILLNFFGRKNACAVFVAEFAEVNDVFFEQMMRDNTFVSRERLEVTYPEFASASEGVKDYFFSGK